ncbi:SGNH/GDSL hydrolase family protein [Gallibacterium genomosp. 1]|uniref:SGNH/GDSL hydrolase family protein n=1 Tax=Gallibacterium genomosp. 1 TaxID=155515 RepID=UPI0008028565|nr:SGNH/GDSL hydrolase family protein [Gallibacterium genomosp. 1]OBW99409.1 hypothetical protein QV04_08245 [Gallibacterium genomosp. 1]
MKKHFLALSVSLALATNAYSVGMPEKLIIFGDSLSDNGNILRFTYNQENVYNEYLANYYGYSSPRHDGNFLTKRNQDGPNYALGGAVANDYLGGLQGALSPKLSDEINNYLGSRRNTQNQDYKYIFWIGGNDLRLADDDISLGDPNISTDQSQNKKIQGSIEAVETQLKKLLINGKAKFVIVPNAPNIANTPNFTNNFLSDGRIYFDGWKSLLGGRKFLGFGWINKDDVIRFLDDQNNHGRPAKDVIYDAFEFVLRKHYNIPQGKPLTSAAFQELQQWKRQFERVYKAETSLVNTFNQGVDKVIENLKAQHPDVTFIRPNIQLLLDEVMSHYTEFGFNNVSGSAANPFTSAVVGWGAGKGRVAAFEPIDGQKGVKDKNYLWGKGYQFVFADQFHPSPKTHRMIADYIMSLLESESGDPTDLTVRRVSTTPFNSTANNIYHSAEGDGVFHVDMHSNDINKSNLNIFNDGRALFASNGGTIQLTNTNITSQGRLGGIINAELGGKIYLTNGHIDIYRTNPYVAPFGVMVNGQSSEVELNKIKLNTFGKETTAITVGNKATLRLQDSQVKTNGIGANVLNLWDSTATIINSTLNTESEGASAIRVFANDEGNLLSQLMMKGSTISAEHYAIKVAKNATKNLPVFEASINNSVINGGIYTEKNAKSYFTIDNNSQWNMSKNSSVYQLNLSDSSLNLSQTTDTWQPKTLEIYEGLIAQNARITLGTDLGNDNSQTDKISVSGDSIINGNLQIEKRYSSLGAKTQFGIKIIDLNANKVNIGNLTLANDVTAGLYQYVLSHGGVGADDQSDYYLTSTYIKQDNKIIPVIIAPTLEETTQPVEKPVVPAEVIAKNEQAVPAEVIAKDEQAVPTLAETAQPVEEPVVPAVVIAKNEQAVPALAETVQPVEKTVVPAVVIAKNEQAVPALAETVQPVEKPVVPAEVIAKNEQAVPALAETVQPVEEPVMPAEVIAKDEQAAPSLAEIAQPVEKPVMPAEVIAKNEQATPSLAETAQPVEEPVVPAVVIAKNEQAVPALAETVQPVEEPVIPAVVIAKNEQAVPALAETVQPVEKPVVPAEVIAKNEQATPSLAETAQPVEEPVVPAVVIAKNEQAVPSLAETAQPVEEPAVPAEVIAKDEQAVPALAETAQPVEKPIVPAEVIAKDKQAVPSLAETTQPVEKPIVSAAVNTQSVPTSSGQGELTVNKLTKTQELNESNELNNSTDIVKKRAKRHINDSEATLLATNNLYQDTPVVTAQNGTTAPASKAAEVQQDESNESNSSTNLDDSTAATNKTAKQTPQSTADNSKTVLPTSITNGTPINRLLNADASLIAALPYISSYVGQLHLDYSRRNPNTPLWSQTSNLDYWVNMAYAHNDVKGKAFLNIKQNSQILAIGKDLVSNTDNLIGISATYSKTTSNVKNEINEHLNLNPYVGKVTSEMVSANGYFAHNWNNWYAQAIISAGRVIHDFKNKDKIRYKQNGYILASEQNIGYRYPFNQDLTLYADLGLQESYHRYSAISVKDINVDAVRESQVNALINLGADYRVANFALSSNIRLIKNLRDFDHLIMNNEWIEDKFVKDSAALSANARYYFTDNISTFINLEYLRSLTKEQKLRRMNYQVGMSIQF